MGQVALVTGAAGGLGRAQVAALADAGGTVSAHARSEPALFGASTNRPTVTPVYQDLSTPAGAREVVHKTVREHGRLDLLVANHATMTMAPLVEADLGDWWRVLETNLLGTYALVQETVRVMRPQGGGRIVIVASEWGVTGWPNATAYAASKAGLITLVKCLGRELSPEGILVNAVAPGVIDTPQLEVDARDAGISLQEMHAIYASRIPVGRIGHPEEVARAVLLLADRNVKSLVGQTLQINGGSNRGRV
ncbi:SDR family oxidoreductase [uncultured Microbacterium sp.]|uniref:SDR family NAD(P)-dependent oxidoreductase n=1 Tax=uncultured Microbacterium sp. TaxID=191216 RepID=UPI0028D51E28|nr:SDR family oxidoreductase [uncultured Microbacterium sp.]